MIASLYNKPGLQEETTFQPAINPASLEIVRDQPPFLERMQADMKSRRVRHKARPFRAQQYWNHAVSWGGESLLCWTCGCQADVCRSRAPGSSIALVVQHCRLCCLDAEDAAGA